MHWLVVRPSLVSKNLAMKNDTRETITGYPLIQCASIAVLASAFLRDFLTKGREAAVRWRFFRFVARVIVRALSDCDCGCVYSSSIPAHARSRHVYILQLATSQR